MKETFKVEIPRFDVPQEQKVEIPKFYEPEEKYEEVRVKEIIKRQNDEMDKPILEFILGPIIDGTSKMIFNIEHEGFLYWLTTRMLVLLGVVIVDCIILTVIFLNWN